MRALILSEIRRLASESGGKPPGVETFSKATGIAQSKWLGLIWARWGDALVEAGYEPNTYQAKFDSLEILKKVATLVIQMGRVPTHAEMMLQRTVDPSFPRAETIKNHFPRKSGLLAALQTIALSAEYSDLATLLPADVKADMPRLSKPSSDGAVYLLKSGDHYKIGRSDQLERRVKEVRVAMPESVTLIHSIRTDDPSGIEAYWHRRFVDRRANGEWFRLSREDVRAFTRRTFQ